MSDLWQLVFVLLSLFVLAEGLAVFALARALGLLQVRLGPEPGALQTSDGLALHAEARPVSGFDLRLQRPVSIDISTGHWGLVFVGVTCGSCRELVRAASRVSKDRRWGARLVVVSQGTHEQNEVFRKIAPDLWLLGDPDGDMHRAYDVERSPLAFLVEDGRIQAKGVVNHRDHLEALLDRLTTERQDARWTPIDGHSPLAEARATPGVQNG